MHIDTIQQLPKVELHCHLDGSLSLKAIRQLAHMANVPLPKTDTELIKLVSAPKETRSLLDYLKPFDVIRPLLQSKEALSLAAYDVASQMAEENVIYFELRYAPELSMDKGLSATDTLMAVADGLAKAKSDFGIESRILVCGMKNSEARLNHQIFDDVEQENSPFLGGFDFAGNEADFPTYDLRDSIAYTQKKGIPLTFHAGECHCAANIAQAITLGIKRIGHGTACYNQPDLIQMIIEQNVTMEICLTSNLHTKAATSIEHFPYLALKQAGARLTINTDNRTVSQTNLTKEYQLFHQYFDCSASDFYTFNRYALEAAFISEQEKLALLNRLKSGYQKIPTNYS